MPLRAEILAVQAPAQIICIWVLVDTSEPMQTRAFRTARTGEPLPELPLPEFPRQSYYIGTVQDSNGRATHVVEIDPP